MTRSPDTKAPLSRKAALAGQLSPAARAQSNLSATMAKLDEMAARVAGGTPASAEPVATAVTEPEAKVLRTEPLPVQAAPAAETPAPAALVQAAPVVAAPVTAVPTAEPAAEPAAPADRGRAARADTLDELRQIIEGSGSSVFVQVPLSWVHGSPKNHRRFALDFPTFKQYLPACPTNWAELSPEEYVMEHWADALMELRQKEIVPAHAQKKARAQLAAAFEIGQSVLSLKQIHTPSGYLRYDEQGNPSHVELTSGEQRVRGYLMVGMSHVLMEFDQNAATVTDPALEYERQALRIGENMKVTGLSPAERLEALAQLYDSYRDFKGVDVVDNMTTKDILADFRHAISLSRAHAGRHMRVIRNPKRKLLVDLCDRHELSIETTADIAQRAFERAELRDKSMTDEDVYAAALELAGDVIPLKDVPMEIAERIVTQRSLQAVRDAHVHAAPEPTAAELELAELRALDRSPTPLAPENRGGVELAPPAAQGQQGASDERRRYTKSPANKRLQSNLGWTVGKGPSHAEAHRNLYTNAMLLVALIEAPTIPQRRIEQLRELSRLMGIPAELSAYREGLASLMDDYQLPFSALNRSHLESQRLLDQLASSSNCLETIRAYFAEQNENADHD